MKSCASIVEQPDLMPYYPPKRALKRGIDLAWGKKQITASVTSSILQGKSIKGMADDLQKRITTMNRDSAIRTARTAVTGAQNAGRMDSYAAAEKMGIKLKKEWLAADFQHLKYNEPEKWNFVKLDKKRRDALRAHPERALPGEKKTAATEKFTKYLFNPDNPQGWAKGAAFSSRLGYTAENYADLRREIISGARRYPAVNKGDNGFGVRYEQKMVLYGKTGNPANVTVGWIYKDGVARMTTAYISEV